MANENQTRRHFLRTSLGMAAALPAILVGGRAALAAERLKESDPAAKALNYVHDVSDAKDNPAYKEGSTCANCQFFKGSKDDTWAPCTIFKGKEVKANGWCKSWVKAS